MEINQNNKNDKRNTLLGLLLVGGVVFYIWKTRKPKAYAIESGESSGGGGGGGGFMPVLPTPIVTPAPAPAPAPAPVTTPPKPDIKAMGSGGSFTVNCGAGYIYDPAKKACVPIKEDKPVSEGTTAKPPSGSTPTYGGMPTGPVGGAVTPPDPCGGVGVYDPVTKSCKVSSTGGGVVGTIPFSGNAPLTLDNLLM
jgi:hypothetical protein